MILSCALWVGRFFVCPVYESPKFLASIGRDEAAVEVIQKIAKRNKTTTSLTVEDLQNAAMPYMTEDEITAMKKGQSKEMSSLDLIKLAMTNTSTGHIKALFSTPRLAFSTSLITVIYGTLGLAYPLFYAFLGTYLEAKLGEVGSGDNSINATYGAYVYQAACGIPGSFLAAAMVEIPRGGRKFAMAFFTLCAGLFLFGLTQSRNAVQVNALTCMAAFFSNAYCTFPFYTTAMKSSDR
jgi:O-antigen ligase